MSGGGRKTLKTLIGTYPHTAPLKSSALRSDRLDFEFTEIVPVWDGFKGMIRDDKYDVSEMAVVTYLLAKAHGKPLALLPAAMVGRFQHPYAIYNASKGPMTPADLKGKRVGIRSFTTTTGAWIRGILANDYGVDLDSIQWVTFEEPHVAEYKDTTQRAREGKKIVRCCSTANSTQCWASPPMTRGSNRCSAILRPRRDGGTPSTRWCRSTISWSCARTTSRRLRTTPARSIACCGKASGWRARQQLRTQLRSVSKPTGRASR
jgi:hypothetical protein